MGESTVEFEIGYELKRVQHALRLRMDEALKQTALTTPQYSALSILEASPGLSGAELARQCFVTPQTMNKILANLVAAGLVERRAHPRHGRVLQAHLTKKGSKRLAEAHRVIEDVEERMLANLGRKKRSRFLEALRSCTGGLALFNGKPAGGVEIPRDDR